MATAVSTAETMRPNVASGTAARPVREDFVEFLLTRRSVGRVFQTPVPRHLIEKLIEVACAAPNHHHTQPWRFAVLTGSARGEAGAHLEAALRSRLPEPDSPAGQSLLAKERAKLLRAPVVIVVAVHPSPDPRVLPVEEIASGSAACQNILLAAQALGLGATWRTGDTAYDSAVVDALGFVPGDSIVGFIYVGYPDPAQPPGPRPKGRSPRELTRWLGE